MTSSPVVPQDEILSRILFNRALGQITPTEGIQVASAAATLAGGGPGVLDRMRGKLGLDRLALGSGQSGAASSNLNPAAGGSSAKSPSISGGKYVADGVYVGATQGLTPQSSKVIVEIEVRPAGHRPGRFQPKRRHRARPQLQIRLLSRPCCHSAVGWAERSEAHRFPGVGRMMGFAALSPSYEDLTGSEPTPPPLAQILYRGWQGGAPLCVNKERRSLNGCDINRRRRITGFPHRRAVAARACLAGSGRPSAAAAEFSRGLLRVAVFRAGQLQLSDAGAGRHARAAADA